MPESPLERYLSKIAPPNEDGCRLWLGTPSKDGYGVFYVDGRTTAAHRWGYERLVGPIPTGKVLRFRCENPLCQEPTHWYLVSKEGWAPSTGAKLTEDDVRAIREKHAKGNVSYRALAREFGVLSYQTIYNIVKRNTWKQVK